MSRRAVDILRGLGHRLGQSQVGEPAPAVDGYLPHEPRRACVFCGATDHVIPFHGKGICVDCVREVRELVSGG